MWDFFGGVRECWAVALGFGDVVLYAWDTSNKDGKFLETQDSSHLSEPNGAIPDQPFEMPHSSVNITPENDPSPLT